MRAAPHSPAEFKGIRTGTLCNSWWPAERKRSLDRNSGTPARLASEEMLQVDTPSSLALRANMPSLLAAAGVMIKALARPIKPFLSPLDALFGEVSLQGSFCVNLFAPIL